MLVPIPRAPHDQYDSMSIIPYKKEKPNLYNVILDLQTMTIKAKSLNRRQIKEQIPKDVATYEKGWTEAYKSEGPAHSQYKR